MFLADWLRVAIWLFRGIVGRHTFGECIHTVIWQQIVKVFMKQHFAIIDGGIGQPQLPRLETV